MDSADGGESASLHLKKMTSCIVAACVGCLWHVAVLWWGVSFGKPFPPRRLLGTFFIHLPRLWEIERYSLPVTEKTLFL